MTDEAKAKSMPSASNARVEASNGSATTLARGHRTSSPTHVPRAEADAAQITPRPASIESQQQQALVSLKGEVGVLATALAGKILGSKLENDDVQSSMIDQMIADLDSDKK